MVTSGGRAGEAWEEACTTTEGSQCSWRCGMRCNGTPRIVLVPLQAPGGGAPARAEASPRWLSSAVSRVSAVRPGWRPTRLASWLSLTASSCNRTRPERPPRLQQRQRAQGPSMLLCICHAWTEAKMEASRKDAAANRRCRHVGLGHAPYPMCRACITHLVRRLVLRLRLRSEVQAASSSSPSKPCHRRRE